MKALNVLIVLLFLVFVFDSTQAQTTINRSDIPTATYFYMPIGDRNSDIRSDLRWDFRPETNSDPTQLFPGWNGVDSNGWYVATDFNSDTTYTGDCYDVTPPACEDYHPAEDWNGNGGQNTDLGQPIYATAVGRVIYRQDASSGKSFGNMIQIVHYLPNDEYVLSMYAHMDQILVNEGDLVYPTTQIGTVGNTKTERAHLHWEIRQQSFLDLSDPNSVSLKNSYPYTPTRWPGANTAFIANNYYDPTDFIKANNVVGQYGDGWHTDGTSQAILD